MNATVGFDPRAVLVQLRALGASTGLAIRDLMHDQMQLWLKEAIKRTSPPDQFGGLAQGKRAVLSDTLNAFASIPPSVKIYGPGRGNYVVYRARGGAKWASREADYLLDASDATLRARHRSVRNSRGRIMRKRDGRLGGLALHYQAHVRRDRLRAFIRKKQDAVGTLKAGWLPALDHYAGLAKVSPRVSAVLRRKLQIGDAGGRIDRTGNGEIWADNDVRYARGALDRSTFMRLEGQQREKIQRYSAERIRQLVDRFNGGGGALSTRAAQ
jgi:hypothetical protein